MDGHVAVVGVGIDAMQAVVLEQLGDHGRERLGRQPGPLMRWRQRDADLGGRRLIRDDAHGAVAAERPATLVDRGQLHPRARRAELDISLGGEEPLGVDQRVRRIPRLVPRDLRLAAVGDEGREVVGAKRPQAQSLRDDPTTDAILPGKPPVASPGCEGSRRRTFNAAVLAPSREAARTKRSPYEDLRRAGTPCDAGGSVERRMRSVGLTSARGWESIGSAASLPVGWVARARNLRFRVERPVARSRIWARFGGLRGRGDPRRSTVRRTS